MPGLYSNFVTQLWDLGQVNLSYPLPALPQFPHL